MSTPFACRVITPAGSAFDGDATYVSFPAWDGQYGVMAGMAPILSRLGDGPLHIQGDQERTFHTQGGFAHVRDGVLTILSDEIVDANEADAAGG